MSIEKCLWPFGLCLSHPWTIKNSFIHYYFNSCWNRNWMIFRWLLSRRHQIWIFLMMTRDSKTFWNWFLQVSAKNHHKTFHCIARTKVGHRNDTHTRKTMKTGNKVSIFVADWKRFCASRSVRILWQRHQIKSVATANKKKHCAQMHMRR